MAVELHHLRCAVVIADLGSFTAAADALHLTQPTLSYAMARLERELGAKLFERTASGARLTDAGKAFLDPARRSLLEAENARVAVEAVTGVLTGQLRAIGIRHAIVETARLLARFHQRHPGVAILLAEPTSDADVMDAVRVGRCDVGIVRSQEVEGDLPSVPAGSRQLVVIFSEATAPRQKILRLDELGAMSQVAPLPGTAARQEFDDFWRNSPTKPPIGAECSNEDGVVELVRAGLGAAFMSRARAEDIRTGGVVIREVRHPGDDLSAIRRPAASPAVEAFFSLLGEEAH
jgi:DNA-binding transcriptional LysR family regulator